MTTTEKDLKLRRPTKYKHFMVDCETLGTTPNLNPVLQIAIVEFDPVSFKPTGKSIEAFLPLVEQLNKGAVADQGTVEWWGKQNPEVLKTIMAGVNAAGTLEDELMSIYRWVDSACAPCKDNKNKYQSMFWAKPAAFDYPYVDGLFIKAGVPSPFHYRNVTDMSSFITANFLSVHKATKHHDLDFWMAQQLYWNAMDTVKQAQPKLEDAAHNASADCLFQIEWLREAFHNTDFYLDKL